MAWLVRSRVGARRRCEILYPAMHKGRRLRRRYSIVFHLARRGSARAGLILHWGSLGTGACLMKSLTTSYPNEQISRRRQGHQRRNGTPCACADCSFFTVLSPATCLGETSNHLPAKATKELPPELLSLLRQKKMPKYSPILVRLFKEEAELEVWKQDTTGLFKIPKVYPICRWSGDLGPKLKQGDRQTPEGKTS